jgi:DNA-binding response OmpR family regulator
MLKYILEIWNYRVIEAVSGEEALEKSKQFQPDIILMDLMLPKTNGIVATRRIRELSNQRQAVIIFLSAYTEDKSRAAAMAAGADDFLNKPVDFGRLELSLENNFNTKSKLNRLYSEVI